MGFRDFFSSYTQTERALLEQYTSMISMTMTSSQSEARQMAEDMLRQAIEESKKEGTYHLPRNLGTIILGKAGGNDPSVQHLVEVMKQNIPKKKAGGVRDEDILWWWNLNDVERRMMLKVDDMTRSALFMQQLSEGKASDEAAATVRKFHPMYGDPDDTTHTSGQDRPLPYELKDRINTYVERRAKADPLNFRKEVEGTSTFNALVRKEIRAGNI